MSRIVICPVCRKFCRYESTPDVCSGSCGGHKHNGKDCDGVGMEVELPLPKGIWFEKAGSEDAP